MVNGVLNVKIVVFILLRKNKSVGLKNKEIWFKKWIVGKQTYEQISAESGYSVSTLQRYFNVMLSKAPLPRKMKFDEVNPFAWFYN